MTSPLKATTIVDGRTYIAIVYPEHRNDPFHQFAKIYRARKDGSAGLLLSSVHPQAWRVWKQIDCDICAECDRLGFPAKRRA